MRQFPLVLLVGAVLTGGAVWGDVVHQPPRAGRPLDAQTFQRDVQHLLDRSKEKCYMLDQASAQKRLLPRF